MDLRRSRNKDATGTLVDAEHEGLVRSEFLPEFDNRTFRFRPRRQHTGEGTAGQILKNKQLYDNMNGAVTDLRTLITEIKKDPKKYLAVKVSIF